jgi:hypothetical protein
LKKYSKDNEKMVKFKLKKIETNIGYDEKGTSELKQRLVMIRSMHFLE